MQRFTFIHFFTCLLLGLSPALKANVTMPAMFGDHMVLQQSVTLPVWGKADPGEKVTVTVGSSTGSATAAADGKWRVDLAPLKVSKDPITMTVTGNNTLTFSDVLIGDVWACSGQSNMEYGIKGAHTPSPIPVKGYRLVWSDEFDGNRPDMAKWDFRTDSKMWSMQKPENVSVSNGLLRIGIRKEEAGGMHYTGGGVISKDAFCYGYYEARLKIPPGAGWHTSFWMMLHNGKGGTGAGSACQELDVIENDSINHNGYGVNIHKWKGMHVPFGGKTIKTPDLAANFHVYGCEFTPSTVNYYFDSELVQSVDITKAVMKGNIPVDFEHGPQHIWLTSIASHLGRTRAVDDAQLPSAAEFDYVRFYEKIPTPENPTANQSPSANPSKERVPRFQ